MLMDRGERELYLDNKNQKADPLRLCAQSFSTQVTEHVPPLHSISSYQNIMVMVVVVVVVVGGGGGGHIISTH